MKFGYVFYRSVLDQAQILFLKHLISELFVGDRVSLRHYVLRVLRVLLREQSGETGVKVENELTTG